MQNNTYQLNEYEPDIVVQPEANNWLRFANLLLDYYLMVYPGFYVIAHIIRFCAPILDIDINSLFHSNNIQSTIATYAYYCSIYILMFTLIEGLTKGRTLGKLITGTKAVRTDGSTITWKDAFIRSVCRLIPFEPLSAFSSNGLWHDRISRTTVIVVRK